MPKTSIRIPFPGPLPDPLIIPRSATSLPVASNYLAEFLRPNQKKSKTLFLTGAGLSTSSGLADYRGVGGTYTLNPSYRPIYYHEFLESHPSRQRYWARSFLGWPTMRAARPNAAHHAIATLASAGDISAIITQNVDSFHTLAIGAEPKSSAPAGTISSTIQRQSKVPIIELHGYLRALVCITCHNHLPRSEFQSRLSALNPKWARFLDELIASGALATENPEERKKLGFRTNPDGDAQIAGTDYSTFKYPPCPTCLANPPTLKDGSQGKVFTDDDGAWKPGSTVGVLKPNVTMFGENIHPEVRAAAENAVETPHVDRVLVIGSSLATYSAWRLIKRAHDLGMKIGILNLGGVRKEDGFYSEEVRDGKIESGRNGIRLSLKAEDILPEVVKLLGASERQHVSRAIIEQITS
ncbi:putative sir2 family histone [Phaeomoniella chlamydospora]|uniref:Putative sir2 family histone n=1 Tax=Phaeomoniella chlamydospora TaxID=158046 RepID=A0A0G2ET59_PHACM|nr:putative sir2 family histone [Phaeomoniella chlamydospora]